MCKCGDTCFLFTFFTNSLFSQKICFSNNKKFQIDLKVFFVAETNFLRKKMHNKRKIPWDTQIFFMKLQQFEKFVVISRKSRSCPQSFSVSTQVSKSNFLFFTSLISSSISLCFTFFSFSITLSLFSSSATVYLWCAALQLLTNSLVSLKSWSFMFSD